MADDQRDSREEPPTRSERLIDRLRRYGRAVTPDVGIDERGIRLRWPRPESRQAPRRGR